MSVEFHSFSVFSISKNENAFAPYVGFGVLMTSKLGTNVILMRYVCLHQNLERRTREFEGFQIVPIKESIA